MPLSLRAFSFSFWVSLWSTIHYANSHSDPLVWLPGWAQMCVVCVGGFFPLCLQKHPDFSTDNIKQKHGGELLSEATTWGTFEKNFKAELKNAVGLTNPTCCFSPRQFWILGILHEHSQLVCEGDALLSFQNDLFENYKNHKSIGAGLEKLHLNTRFVISKTPLTFFSKQTNPVPLALTSGGAWQAACLLFALAHIFLMLLIMPEQ